jgi:hypothetical protein
MDISNETKQFGRGVAAGRKKRGFIRRSFDLIGYLIAALFVFGSIAAYHEKSASDLKREKIEDNRKSEKAAALTAAQERGFQIMEAATPILRSCIRSAIGPAYQSGVYGKSQLTKFVKDRCYPSFFARYSESGLGSLEIFEETYGVIVEQEISQLQR